MAGWQRENIAPLHPRGATGRDTRAAAGCGGPSEMADFVISSALSFEVVSRRCWASRAESDEVS